MNISTTNKIAGREIAENLGIVTGNTVQTRWIGRDIAAGLKTIIGGEIKGYTEMITEARKKSIKAMKKQAEKLEADAVVGVRFSTTTVMGGAAEILAYGTAVKLK